MPILVDILNSNELINAKAKGAAELIDFVISADAIAENEAANIIRDELPKKGVVASVRLVKADQEDDRFLLRAGVVLALGLLIGAVVGATLLK